MLSRTWCCVQSFSERYSWWRIKSLLWWHKFLRKNHEFTLFHLLDHSFKLVRKLLKPHYLVIKHCKEFINDDGTDDDETMKDVETKDANEENSSKDSSRDSGICFNGLRRKISWCMSHGMREYKSWVVEESDLTVAWRNQENIVKAAILGWHDVSRK